MSLKEQNPAEQTASPRFASARKLDEPAGDAAIALQKSSLLRDLKSMSNDASLDQRLRLATLNLIQDAIEARRAEELEVRRRELAQAAVEERDTQLRLALDIASIGAFTWDIAAKRCEADERMRALCGVPTDEQHDFATLLELVPALDAERFSAAVSAALQPGGSGSVRGDFEVRRADGSHSWLSITARTDFADRPRRAIRMRGAVLDVTDRRRAEDMLRASELRFRQFAMASSDVLWIRDADTFDLEFVSSAFGAVFGVPSESVLDPNDLSRWLLLVVPDDREAVRRHLERARQGAAVVYECRIMRASDGVFRWIRNTDFPLLDANGKVRRIAGIVSDITDSKQLLEYQTVLVAELQHRVRNIMAMLRAIASRTGATAQDVESYSTALSGRLMAIARTQALLTRTSDAGVDVHSIVRTEVAAQMDASRQCKCSGPSVILSPKAAEVLTLVVHELTTNAAKYGAFASAEGQVDVSWRRLLRDEQPWLEFSWQERCEPAAPATMQRKGFGTELIEERVPYELRGRGELRIEPGGARCVLEFPLGSASSVLETDAPRPRRVDGGSLDVHGIASLTNVRILVVEDDFYVAGDAERALRSAGAIVEGPYPTEAEARAALDRRRPDCAMIDINLGAGPSFDLAQRLREQRVPFVFVTGYDHEAIPGEFAGVTRLEKPVDIRAVVQSLAALIRDAA